MKQGMSMGEGFNAQNHRKARRAMGFHLIGAATVIIGFQCAAFAGPSSGTTYVNYTLVLDPDSADPLQIDLPANEIEENISVGHDTRSPSVFVFQDYTMNKDTNTGWHIHHGVVLITIAEGSVEWYDTNCALHVRRAGDFFTESDQLHYVRNVGSAPARLIITFVIAKGETNKIYKPAPPCAAARGLIEPRTRS
jgi:hypothetical protein